MEFGNKTEEKAESERLRADNEALSASIDSLNDRALTAEATADLLTAAMDQYPGLLEKIKAIYDDGNIPHIAAARAIDDIHTSEREIHTQRLTATLIENGGDALRADFRAEQGPAI